MTSHAVHSKEQFSRSLSAVSEAPTSEELRLQTVVCGRFRYSDLKEAAGWGPMGIVLRRTGFDDLRDGLWCQCATVSVGDG